MPEPSISTWCFRLALKLFPRWFRDEYEEEMVSTFAARASDPRGRPWFFAARSILAVIPAAFAVRGDNAGTQPGRSPGGAHRFLDDLAQASRSLRRSPGWTLAALAILTLGIGGTTAVFSVLNAVLLRPLPFDEPDRLVSLWTVNEVQNLPDGSSWENAEDWVARSGSLEDVALIVRPEFTTSTVTSLGEPERIHIGQVSPNFFELLGVGPVHGRLFGGADLDLDTRVVVISEGLWSLRYGRDTNAVGSSLTLDGEEYRIIGVASSELALPRRETQVWQLSDVRSTDGVDRRGRSDAYWVLGRLRPNVSIGEAQRDLDRVAAELQVQYPDTNRDRGVSMTSLRDEIVGTRLPLLLWTVLGSMVLVLLIGSTNVAQLMLSRGVQRRREMAVRASLGATRARINRQLLLESLLLSVVAGAGGVALAYVGMGGLLALVPADVPLVDTVRVDRTVLALGIGVAAFLAPLVGLLPALAASRTHAGTILRSGGRGSTGRDRRTRSVLVVAEVAMAAVLLSGAGLLLRSAWLLQDVDPGFDARSTLIAHVNLSSAPDDDSSPVHEALVQRLNALPTVEGVGTTGVFFVERIPDQTITVVGSEPRPEGTPTPRLTTDEVYPGFFEALGVPLLQGRVFDLADIGDPYRPERVIVNRTWVDTFSPDQPPVGRQFRWGRRTEGPTITVVGVVADLQRTTLEEAAYPQMFVASAPAGFDILVRTAGDPLGVAPALRGLIHDLDPSAAVSRVSNAWDRYDVRLAPRHFQTFMLGSFAALATVLAAIGLFAILHDAVASRRREIGIRVALGAAPERVRRMVLRQGFTLSCLGLVLGMGGTLLLSGITSKFLFGIQAADPLTLSIVAASLLAVTLIASVLPARQATSVTPMEALTAE